LTIIVLGLIIYLLIHKKARITDIGKMGCTGAGPVENAHTIVKPVSTRHGNTRCDSRCAIVIKRSTGCNRYQTAVSGNEAGIVQVVGITEHNVNSAGRSVVDGYIGRCYGELCKKGDEH